VTIGTTERILRRTRRRLFAVTMGLLALLVVGIGATTAVVALRALDGSVDQALTGDVKSRADAANADGRDANGQPLQDADAGTDLDRPTGASDTFVLVLNAAGAVTENRSNYPTAGLPYADAITAAGKTGSDLRTASINGVDTRLYTLPVSRDGVISEYVQGGIKLALHDSESRILVLTIAAVGVVGLIGAALITLLVTGRALRPVRDGFEAQRRFVADASHELRTPAALIRANAEVLEREHLVSEEGREFVTDIVAEADRLGLLVGDLLQLAAWDDTKLAVAIVTVDASSLTSDTLRGATALAAERGVGLALDSAGPVYARADRDRLVQLLLILVDNAVDHSPKGTTVTVRVRQAASEAVIEVEDEGPGIPREAQERIFEPFTRLHGTTRHGSGGTGLGLAIARRITDAMSGTISVSSPEGAGAKFTVTLPTGTPGADEADEADGADGAAEADEVG
jgi:signal transduction histidine kinase